jgi:hypothetical protein
MEGGKEKAAEPILITFSGKDIDRIYWRFFWNSVLLSVVLSVAGFFILVFTSMRFDTRPSRSAADQTSIRSTSSEPISTATTPQIAESTPEAVPATEPKTESTVTTTANCVEKMQSGQIEAYNECIKNK